jgi:hypothetical protein
MLDEHAKKRWPTIKGVSQVSCGCDLAGETSKSLPQRAATKARRKLLTDLASAKACL